MDNRTLLALLLMLGIWFGWVTFVAPPPPAEVPPEAAVTDVEPAAGVAPATVSAAVSGAPERVEPITLCGVKAEVSTRGGALRATVLPDVRARFQVMPIYSWAFAGFPQPWLPYGGEPGPEIVLGPQALGAVASAGALTGPLPDVVVEVADGRVTTRGRVGDLDVTRVLREEAGSPCRIRASVTWTDISGASPVVADPSLPVPPPVAAAKGFAGERWVLIADALKPPVSSQQPGLRPGVFADGDHNTWDDLTDIVAEEKVEGAAEWIGLADHTFGAYLVTAAGKSAAARIVPRPGATPEDPQFGAALVFDAPVPPGGSVTEELLFFVGLKQTDALAAQDTRLENALSLGFFSVFAWPLLLALKLVNTVVGSWGWSILVLTLLVKIAFWPLQIRSFRSAAEMQSIQPELTAIREKLKDKPEELNRATAALFSERGVSPLGGCLPMLVQLPVWIALFAALTSSVELYQAQWFWLRDLSAPDPTLVLPVLMTVGMLLQQRMTPTTGLDPAQANMMKAMPLLFGFLYLNLPSGLALYSIANLGISVLQQWMFKRTQAVVSPPAASPSA